MPIKPENRSRYPANWKEIRASILARARHCCEKCRAPNGAVIARGAGRDAGTYITDDAYVFDADTGMLLGKQRQGDYEAGRFVKIVLTIAHLDHTPENCDPENLRAWCQKCHLQYDAQHHAENAKLTRRSRKAIGDLFAETLGREG
tara:strand:+ start:2711 stop:3148 length:438 start_codon:yes stop_codon:yes gene_type:complete